MEPLSREAELLLTSLRPAFDEAAAARVRALIQSGLDWNFLNQLATRHRLSPLVYRRVDAAAATDVPRAVFIEMWRQYEQNARRNRTMLEEMRDAVDRLSTAGIRVVAYKGPLLALQLYDDVTLREFEDLDLLIDVNQVSAAKDLLLRNGYVAHDDLTPAAEDALRNSAVHYHLGFVQPDSGTKLELHWKSDPEFQVERTNDPSWWASLDRIGLDGQEVLSFSASELLMVLCLHGAKHQGHRLGWIAEIAALIRKSAIDWPWMMRFAHERQCMRRVLAALKLSEQLLNAELPKEITDQISNDGEVERLCDDIASRMFSHSDDERQGLDRLRISLRLYDRLPQRARHAWQVAFSPTMYEYSARTLPRGLEFLYVPIRMIRLFGKYGLKRS